MQSMHRTRPPSCPAWSRTSAWPQVPKDLDLTLPPEATSSLSGLSVSSAQWPHVGMLNTSVNQDGCKGASVILDFSGSGVVDE